MTRRKAMAQREPNGRVVRVQATSTSEAKRLRDAALSGMRDPSWGTELGRLYLADKVTASEFAAGKRWAEEVSLYLAALQCPSPDPKAMNLNRSGGSPVDPDSPQGRQEAKRHLRAIDKFKQAHKELVEGKQGGMLVERAVRTVCVDGRALAGHDDLLKLKMGLSALASLWGLTGTHKSVVR